MVKVCPSHTAFFIAVPPRVYSTVSSFDLFGAGSPSVFSPAVTDRVLSLPTWAAMSWVTSVEGPSGGAPQVARVMVNLVGSSLPGAG